MNTATYSDLFASLEQFQDEHAALVKEVGGSLLSASSFQRVQSFVHRCVASGAVLEASSDRVAAQSLITYWVGRLDRAIQDSEQAGELVESEDILLEKFDQDAFNALVVTPTESWLAEMNPIDRMLVQRIVLRLLNLRADGRFETIPNTRTVLEGLEPLDRANQILQGLVQRGVVRRVRHSLEFEEYSLQPLERLKDWLSLQSWMEERRRFRELATQIAGLRSDHVPGQRRLPRRILSTLFQQVLGMFGRVQATAEPMYRLFRKLPAEVPLTDAQFEEAENYRDKNVDEVRLIYQKRQLDKQQLAAAHEKLVLLTLSAVGLAVLVGVAFVQWRQAQNAVKSCSLRFVNQQFRQSATRLIEDPAGSMLFAAEALAQFDKAESVIRPRENSQRLRDSFLLTLSRAQLEVPILTGMAFHDTGTEAETVQKTTQTLQALSQKSTILFTSSEACLMLTLRASERAEAVKTSEPSDERELVVQLRKSSGGTWSLPSKRIFPIQRQYLESDSSVLAYGHIPGQVAITISSPMKKSAHLFYLSGEGAGQSLKPIATFGGLVDAKWSWDGEYLAVAVPSHEMSPSGDEAGTDVRISRNVEVAPQARPAVSEIILYRTHDWTVAARDTFPAAVGSVAFAPRETLSADDQPSSPVRIAAVVSSAEEPELLCYEWEFHEANSEKPLTRKEFFLDSDQSLRTDFAIGTALVAYCASRPNLLLVTDDKRDESIAWLVATDRSVVTPLVSAAATVDTVPVTCGAFSPNGEYLAVGKKDGHLAVWSLSPEKAVEAQPLDLGGYVGHSEQVFGLSFSPDSQYLVTGSRDKTAKIFDLASQRLASPPLWHSGTVNSARFTADGRHVVTLTKDVAFTWELPRTNSPHLSILVQAGRAVRHRSLSRDGRIFVAGGDSHGDSRRGWAQAWDTLTGEPLGDELLLQSPAVHVAVNDSPRLMSVVSEDGFQQLFDNNGRSVWTNTFQQDRHVFTVFANHATQPRLLVMSHDSYASDKKRATIRVFQFKAMQQTFEPKLLYEATFGHALSNAQFDKDGERFVAYSDEGHAIVAEIVSRDKYQELLRRESGEAGSQNKAHPEAITYAEFSADGSRVLTASEDDNAIVWLKKAETGWERNLLDAEANADTNSVIGKHTANINFASFDPAGNCVVTASADGRGIVWRWNTEGQRYEPFISMTSGASSKGMTKASFIDTRYVLGAWDDGMVRIWDTLEASVSDGMHTWELHGREVASYKASYGARMFYWRSPEENSFEVMSLGERSSRNNAANAVAAKTPYAPTQFEVFRWKLDLPTENLSDVDLQEQMICVARIQSARRIADDPLQLEPLPVLDLLRAWKDCGPSRVLEVR